MIAMKIQNGADIATLNKIDELDFGDLKIGEPEKKKEIKITYYKKEKKDSSINSLFQRVMETNKKENESAVFTEEVIERIKNSIDNVPLVVIEDGFIKISDPKKERKGES